MQITMSVVEPDGLKTERMYGEFTLHTHEEVLDLYDFRCNAAHPSFDVHITKPGTKLPRLIVYSLNDETFVDDFVLFAMHAAQRFPSHRWTVALYA